jgi:uncharacterized protein YoaH (UPF0181 family)
MTPADGRSMAQPDGDNRADIRTPDIRREANVSEPTARAAVRVADARPDLAQKVMAGEMSLGEASAVVAGTGERERRAKKEGTKERKKHEDNPREVKQFLEAVQKFSEQLDAAVGVIKFGKFSPEAARFTVRKLDTVTSKIARLSQMLEAVE